MKTNKILITTAMLIVVLAMQMIWIKADEEAVDPIVPYDVLYKPNHSRVYDGDTIQDIYIDVYDLEPKRAKGYPAELMFLGMFIEADDIYCYTDIRIFGIDTPEKKPSKSGRTEESRQAEKAAAQLAQTALFDLLHQHDFKFQIEHAQPDKYFGRIVAQVYVGEGENRINVGDWMIKNKHAVPYDGGTKLTWEEMSKALDIK